MYSTYLLKKWRQTDIFENVNPKFYPYFLNLNEFLFWEEPWKQKMKHLTPNNFQHHLEAYYGHHTLPKPIPVCIATCFDTYKFLAWLHFLCHSCKIWSVLWQSPPVPAVATLVFWSWHPLNWRLLTCLATHCSSDLIICVASVDKSINFWQGCNCWLILLIGMMNWVASGCLTGGNSVYAGWWQSPKSLTWSRAK